MKLKVLIVGAGIIGSSLSRVLSRYENLEVHLVEREPDVGWGVSKATTSIIHPGHEEIPEEHPLRAELCVKGNYLWHRWTRELDIPARWPGELMIALNEEDLKTAEYFWDTARKNRVPGVRLVDSKDLLKLEPNVNSGAAGALWAPTAGMITPMKAVIALVENAVENGVKLHTESCVSDIKIERWKVKGVETNKGFVEADIIINAAGLYSDHISGMAGIGHVTLRPRKGEYCVFDENAYPKVMRILHPTPTRITKGVYITTTPENNLLIGPTAQDLPEDAKEDTSTSKEGLDFLFESARKIVQELPPKSKVIRMYAGLRPEPPDGRWIIEAYDDPWGFINVAGIRSPGLASAPAIAYYVVESLMRGKLDIKLVKKKRWIPYRKDIVKFRYLGREKQSKLIKENSSYGNVVCMCRIVTEAEILEAIKRMKKIGVTITLDGVKFRTFASTGLCQGSYCRIRIAKIIAEKLGVPLWSITTKGKGTEYGIGDVKMLLRNNS